MIYIIEALFIPISIPLWLFLLIMAHATIGLIVMIHFVIIMIHSDKP